MRFIAAALRLFAVLAAMCFVAPYASAQAVEGKDFKPIPPQATSGDKIEVIEFFSYACPHCATLEGPMSQWLKRKPADVEFKRVPAVFNPTWAEFARVYYTLEALGVADKLHHEVFAAVHNQKLRLNEPKVLADWAATKGLDKQKVTDTFNSFTVQSLAKRAADLTHRYSVEFTPSVVVAGRYITGPSMTSPGREVDFPRFFQVLDQMIASQRKKPAGKK